MTTHIAHAVDFSAPGYKGDGARACQNQIAAFVRGIRGPRRSPVSSAQIRKWLRATPAEFVDAQIDAALAAGRIRIVANSLRSHRRASGGYSYVPA